MPLASTGERGGRHARRYSPPSAHETGARRTVGAPLQGDGARRDHWGLARVDVLAGNVGYMKVTGFDGSPAAFEATSAALKYLEGTDAMIFDFRGMGGGSGGQSNFLICHFVSADTVPSLVVTNRAQGTRRTRYTLAKVPGLRRTKVPVWILIDRGTASAGEDFSFVLQQLGRATTVGDRTARRARLSTRCLASAASTRAGERLDVHSRRQPESPLRARSGRWVAVRAASGGWKTLHDPPRW